ncbi:MAG: type I methionyl aminopeptidase, partial [Turicibacter sp.]
DPNLIKTKQQIEGIRTCAEINNAILDLIGTQIKIGISTEEINTLAHDFTIAHGATPADLNYQGYPKSLCVSINEEVCHGIPNENRFLKNGDIVNVDVTTELNGFYSDASRMYMVGEVSAEAKRLVEVTKECLELGIAAIKPWGYISDIGCAIEAHATANGYSIVREFGGHGIGLSMHEDPFVMHYKTRQKGMILVPGMLLTIEPMVNAGRREIELDPTDGWTVRTKDKSLSAQWEHTLLITETGVEIISS